MESSGLTVVPVKMDSCKRMVIRDTALYSIYCSYFTGTEPLAKPKMVEGCWLRVECDEKFLNPHPSTKNHQPQFHPHPSTINLQPRLHPQSRKGA
jgi:hypothetical protein